MAWTAKITSITNAGNGEAITVTVNYYDAADTGLTTVLAIKNFGANANTPSADLRAAIVNFGQAERNVQAKVANAQALVGTTVNVP